MTYCTIGPWLRGKAIPEEQRRIKQLALPKVLRLDALKSYHDSIAGGGHLGVEKVKTAMYQKYYWPGMHSDIVTYIKSCERCQLAKRDYNPFKPPLVPLPPTKRNMTVSYRHDTNIASMIKMKC